MGAKGPPLTDRWCKHAVPSNIYSKETTLTRLAHILKWKSSSSCVRPLRSSQQETHLMFECCVLSSSVELSVQAVHARHHSGILVPAQGVDGWQCRHFIIVIVAAAKKSKGCNDRNWLTKRTTQLAFHKCNYKWLKWVMYCSPIYEKLFLLFYFI